MEKLRGERPPLYGRLEWPPGRERKKAGGPGLTAPGKRWGPTRNRDGDRWASASVGQCERIGYSAPESVKRESCLESQQDLLEERGPTNES